MRRLVQLLALFLGCLPLGAQVTVTGSTIISGSGVACPNCALLNQANTFTLNNTFPSLTVNGGINGLQVYENTGLFNIGLGVDSVPTTATGSQNFGIGDQSLQNLTSGYGNVAIGVGALNSLTTGFEDGCIGDECGVAMTTGYKNWGSGAGALANLTTGAQNTGDGVGACSDLQGSSNTTCLGYLAGSSNIGTYANLPSGLFVGAQALPAANGDTNEEVIGVGVTGKGSNTLTIGNPSITSTTIYGVPTFPQLGGAGSGCIGISNTGLTSTVSCGSGGSSTNFNANGTPLTSTATVNFENSAATDGITLTFTNPSAGNVQLGFTGTLSNAGLANSAITIGGTSVSLGGSTTSFPSPGAIGGTTPSTGVFTALTDSALTPGDCVQATTGGLLASSAGACGSGGSGPTLQVNSVNTTSQVLQNLTNSATITWTNPSGGVVEAALAITPLTGSLTSTYIPKATGASTLANSALIDNGTQITSSEPIGVTGSTPGELVLTAGTGSLGALASNSYGFLAPATGGTSYARQDPSTASSTGGLLLYGAPTTINGQNGISGTWFHPEATIGSGVGTYGSTALYTVIATTVAQNNGHFTNLSVSTLTAGSGCTTPPTFSVFANNNSNPSSYYATASTSETYQNNPVTVAQALAFTAGQNIGIVIEGPGSGCPTAEFVAGATYVEP